MKDILFEIKDLHVRFDTPEGPVRAVNGVTLTLERGRKLGLVGESGSGKSVTSLAVLGLLPQTGARISQGSVLFEGRELVGQPDKVLNSLRGKDLAMIFQEPMTALNPVMTVGNQIGEVLEIHTDLDKKARKARVVDLLTQVGIADPDRRAGAYPHEMSGGMRQRVMIAMALACRPKLLIADEPTTALDVTIQAQILTLIQTLLDQEGTSVVLITHDLAVVAETVDDVAVMYAGQIVEHAPVRELFASPRHPYTRGLLDTIPILGNLEKKLKPIPGRVPNLLDEIVGCPFAPRCPLATDLCREKEAAWTEAPLAEGRSHGVRCHYA